MTASVNGPVVEISPGVFQRKAWEQLQGGDLIVFGGGPDADKDVREAQALIEAEIAAAGGLVAWRAKARQAA